jgi:amidase
MTLGTVQAPTPAQLAELAGELGFSMDADELAIHLAAMAPNIEAYNAVDQMAQELPPVKYPRSPGARPREADNPLGAWYVKTTIEGAAEGKLKGKRVAIKDNVCIAGVPMMNGASTLEGYVPDVDATIVTRILDAGGTILGKAVCEYFCFSGGSHTSASGPVHNALRRGYSAGGSSSGSAALLAAGEVDLAIGGDQGGSIRIPAAYSGICGMKPTHGLVPYTGVMPIELTIDHTGPMSANVADNALMLEVLAGPDGLDPRQHGVPAERYTEALGQGARGLRVAVVKEGFGHANSAPGRLDASVDEVSIPLHLMGLPIWLPIAAEGATMQMMQGNGFGFNWKGLYVTSLLDYHSGWHERADELAVTLKTVMLLGWHMVRNYRGHYYAKAQNLGRQLRAAYDAVLADHDLLLMPTLPLTATPIPGHNAPIPEILQRAFEMLPNTAPFDVTGHPALSLPCGLSDDLPVGLMLVGRHYDEKTIYRAAHAYEQGVDWRTQ